MIIVVDDIAINEEMGRAWATIQAGDGVARSVDLHRQWICASATSQTRSRACSKR
jgi:hypothetical protein